MSDTFEAVKSVIIDVLKPDKFVVDTLQPETRVIEELKADSMDSTLSINNVLSEPYLTRVKYQLSFPFFT